METKFTCFYCGEDFPPSEASKEHIIPACLGATMDKTGTRNVCGACNYKAGEEVDQPFCRDWNIESKRFFQGVVSRGNPPSFKTGRVNWERPEHVDCYFLENKIIAYRFSTVRNEFCVMFRSIGEGTPEAQNTVRKYLKGKFKKHRVVEVGTTRTDKERELVDAIDKIGQRVEQSASIDITAWHRAIVKMGLGLACLYFGERFIKSSQAARLRSFLWEKDPEKRDAIALRGSAGILAQDKVKLTPVIHTTKDVHTFCLIGTGDRVAFFASVFGEFENTLEIDPSGTFCANLPGTLLRGVAWIVDPKTKETSDPTPIDNLVQRRVQAQRLAAEEEFAKSVDGPKPPPSK